MLHLNNRRNTVVSAQKHVDALGEKVLVEVSDEGLSPDRYAMDSREAVGVAEKLLKAAGVKFKITFNV